MKLSWKYPKIISIYLRHPDTHKFVIGEYSTPEIALLKDHLWEATEKVDGTNIRIQIGEEPIYAGRSDEAQLPVPLIHRLDELFKSFEARERLKTVFGEEQKDIFLYGEGFGAKIQKDGLNYMADSVDFVLFDVCVNGLWLNRVDVDDIANQLKIQSVPVVGYMTLDKAEDMTKKGFKSQWGDFIAEGLVLREPNGMLTRTGDRIITKVKYKDYL